MTLLGLTLHHALKWDTHIEGIVTKANAKNYFLVTLKRAGTTREQLVKFYITFIRPGLEYATPVWHPGITKTLSNNIERVQRTSTRIHPELSYERALAETDLPTLHARLEHLCLHELCSLTVQQPGYQTLVPSSETEHA